MSNFTRTTLQKFFQSQFIEELLLGSPFYTQLFIRVSEQSTRQEPKFTIQFSAGLIKHIFRTTSIQEGRWQ